ncbi:hypothetical protein JGS39_24070 [Streptomyces sp. P01-B04]|uniref:hypothetical protein n=1 Tax=Streptomyces poriferorum TaxID=2798799 RepID=UPI001C5CF995|nr:hypothetical protein [Streptomyces poriferorum]MBW5252039.1 hypothetical protein [Streptomyces poriferorum]MBW5260209.1 hypothetical protein [Streptomyces poriferorum]
MTAPTTVVVDGQEPDETTASFEAGVAAATSVQASEEAAEAAGTAEAAAEQATFATQAAGEAVSTAYDAQAGVEGLRGDLTMFMDEMRAALTARATPEPEPEAAPEVPAPEPTPDPEPAAETPKKKRRYGSSLVFGSKAYEDE